MGYLLELLKVNLSSVLQLGVSGTSRESHITMEEKRFTDKRTAMRYCFAGKTWTLETHVFVCLCL